jgi:hypothetical protein
MPGCTSPIFRTLVGVARAGRKDWKSSGSAGEPPAEDLRRGVKTQLLEDLTWTRRQTGRLHLPTLTTGGISNG